MHVKTSRLEYYFLSPIITGQKICSSQTFSHKHRKSESEQATTYPLCRWSLNDASSLLCCRRRFAQIQRRSSRSSGTMDLRTQHVKVFANQKLLWQRKARSEIFRGFLVWKQNLASSAKTLLWRAKPWVGKTLVHVWNSDDRSCVAFQTKTARLCTFVLEVVTWTRLLSHR